MHECPLGRDSLYGILDGLGIYTIRVSHLGRSVPEPFWINHIVMKLALPSQLIGTLGLAASCRGTDNTAPSLRRTPDPLAQHILLSFVFFFFYSPVWRCEHSNNGTDIGGPAVFSLYRCVCDPPVSSHGTPSNFVRVC